MSQRQSQQHSQRHQEQQQQQQNQQEQGTFGFFKDIPDDLTGEVKEGGEVRRRETSQDTRDFIPRRPPKANWDT
jgi:hypothetical protein